MRDIPSPLASFSGERMVVAGLVSLEKQEADG
jgi:hypothetical protein